MAMRGCYEIVTLWNAGAVDDNMYVRHVLPVMCRWTKGGIVVPAAESYRDPNVWDALSESDKNFYFTLREGDLLVLGEKFEEISDEPGHRLNDILEKYKPRAFFIAAIDDRSRARCGAHFFVSGGGR